MSKKIVWDAVGSRYFETGVDRGVLYVMGAENTYGAGVPWNGLTGVTESPSGAEATPMYADNIKYLNLLSNEDYACTINAYTYPDEFGVCDGSAEIAKGVYAGQQTRKTFGFCYRSKIGNDVDGADHGYKLHIVYNCLAAPSEKSHNTVNESPEAVEFSWSISTTPIEIPGFKPTAHLTLDSTKIAKEKLDALETMLYGSESTDPKLPTPEEIVQLFADDAAQG